MSSGRPTEIPGDLRVGGTISGKVTKLSDGCVTKSKIPANEGIEATKLIHRVPIDRQLFEQATTIVAKVDLLHIVRGSAASIVAFEAAIVTKATGTDRVVTVDLKRSTGGGAFATILDDPIEFDDASSNLTPVPAVVEFPDLLQGDLLEAVVAVAGSDAAQALGLIVTLTIDETP